MGLGKILLIDDEDKIRNLLKRIIALEGYTVIDARNLKTAGSILESEHIDVVLLDVQLPDGDGIEYISRIKRDFPQIEVIILTAHGDITGGIQAIKNGAFNYLVKGEDDERIFPLLAQAFESISRAKMVTGSRQKSYSRFPFKQILGESNTIRSIIDLAKRVSMTDATVLLLGETGTGKELFARAIHDNSQRGRNKFLALNCSSFSKELLESELFGHVAGAFTGASRNKKGLIEEASEGTLFLDEIGEMSYDLQSKLLRLLENGEFIKVGDTKTTTIQVRIIAATNRDLLTEVNEGRFREDLFYRLNHFMIVIPPLRERVEDIPILASHFLHLFKDEFKSPVTRMSKDFINHLELHQWDGNIRELKNIIERAMIITNGIELSIEDLPVDMQTLTVKNNFSAFELASIEKLHIQRVLNFTRGNKIAAAKLMNIGLTTLYRKIEEYKTEIPL